MKSIRILFENSRILIFLSLALLLVAGCAPAVEAQPAASADAALAEPLALELTIEEAFQLVKDGAFLLDVRTQEEWDEYHAPQATLIPLDELPTRLGELPQDQSIVVICRSGNRSAAARDYLLEAGFGSVTSSGGGMQAWEAAGFPVE